MADKLTLYVCNINEEGPPSSRGLQTSPTSAPRRQHDFDKIVFARGIPFGLFATARRPGLKASAARRSCQC